MGRGLPVLAGRCLCSARRARYVRQARAAIAISTVRKIHLNMVLRYPPQRGLHEAVDDSTS